MQRLRVLVTQEELEEGDAPNPNTQALSTPEGQGSRKRAGWSKMIAIERSALCPGCCRGTVSWNKVDHVHLVAWPSIAMPWICISQNREVGQLDLDLI